jgi:hypothetical protein
MSITPNIVRAMELPDKDAQVFWSGTEEAYDIKPLFVTTTGKSSKPPEKPFDKASVIESLARRETTTLPAAGNAPKAAQSAAPTPSSSVSSAVLLEIKPPDAPVSVGQEVRFELMAGGAKDLYGAIVTLSYDPKVVEFKIASEGALLKKDNQQTSFLFSNNIKAGTVDIYMTRIGDVGGVDGAGSLCTLVFQAKSGGTSDISMKSVKLTNFSREQLKTELKGAQVIVK